MKKLAILLTITFSIFICDKTYSQILDSANVTTPILCNGQTATVTFYMTQSIPAVPVKLMNYQKRIFPTFSSWLSIGSFSNTTGLTQQLAGLTADINTGTTTYRTLMVDSAAFWTAFPPRFGTLPFISATQITNANHPSIYGYVEYTVTGVPELLSTSIQTGSSLCFGDCDGSQNISIQGGTPPYSITINGPGLVNQNTTLALNATDKTYQNLCAGTYSYVVTDANGCSTTPSTELFTITPPSELTPAAAVSSNFNGSDISCFGSSDGEITASVSGGTPPYQYSIDSLTYSTNPVFDSLSSGTYTIYYKDTNGCHSSENVTLSDPPILSGSVLIDQLVSCFGTCNGVIEFNVDSLQTGTPPYTFSKDFSVTFQNSNVFSNLCGDQNYTIIAKDNNGCVFSDSITLVEPTELSFDVSTSNYNGYAVSCNGASDGQIIILNPSGGTPNYQYSFDGGGLYTNFLIKSNLSSNSYSVKIKDSNGCTKDTLVALSQPNPIEVNYASDTIYNGVEVSCFGICDGSIIANHVNGVGITKYSLLGLPLQLNPVFSNLCGENSYGNYELIAVDENGCSDSLTISLSESLEWLYTTDSASEACGFANGQASIFVSQGGVHPLTYIWNDSSSQNTPTADSLRAGLYSVIVSDTNNCSFTKSVSVTEHKLTLSFDSVPPCDGTTGGSATVFPNGKPPYQISWFDGSTSNTVFGLVPGNINEVTVTDSLGCQVTGSVTIPTGAQVQLNLDANSILSVDCYGDQSSQITLSASGGTGPNTYLYYIPNTFPTPQVSNVFNGLYAGTYTIFAKDANNCKDSTVVIITQPDEITFSSSTNSVSCNSGSDGSLTVNAFGGSPPYNYLWSNGSTNQTINNLVSGNYYVSVTDTNGCVSSPLSDTLTITEPSPLQSLININKHATCSGPILSTGEMTAAISGGTPGYNLIWSNNLTTNKISRLAPGKYGLTITDSNGCLLLDSAEILPGQNPKLDVLVQDVSCFGANDGMIYTSAVLGTSPYKFSIDGSNTFFPTGTSFGPTGNTSYIITVVDSLGCKDTGVVSVNEPSELLIGNVLQNNISCFDSSDGNLTVLHSGGTGPYSYSWSDPFLQNTQTSINLSPGTFKVIVSDTNGCSDTSLSYTITQPDSLYLMLDVTPVTCYGGADGSVSVIANGGTKQYNFLWNNGSNDSLINNLSSSSYSVKVVDDNGCSRSKTAFVNQPAELFSFFQTDSVKCVGGSDGRALANISGGIAPYNYFWSNNEIANPATSLFAGINTLQVIDGNGCLLIDSVEIYEPARSVEIDSVIINPISCYGANNATINILASGGEQPYLYSYNNGLNLQSNIGFINVSNGEHIAYVSDQKGCLYRDTIFVDQPDSLYIDSTIFNNIQCHASCDGSIQSILVLGGTPPYIYSVNGGLQQSSFAYFNGYCAGTYTVEVFDQKNCVAQDLITIDEPSELNVQIVTSDWNNYQIKCNGESSGYADFLISGGVSPYTKICINLLTGDTIHSSTASRVNSISAGPHRFIVKDFRGCVYSTDITYYEPDPITHTFSFTNVSCDGWNNGSITDIVSGGVGTATTYIYAWDTGDSTYSISNLGVNVYTITVTDENNCSSTASQAIDNSLALSAYIDSSITKKVSCFDFCDGIVALNVNGGVPNIDANGNPVYSFQWDDILSQTTKTAIGLCVNNSTDSSTYTCIVSDSQGCNDTISFTLKQPSELQVTASISSEILCHGDNNGKLKATATGGNGGKQYLWNNANNFVSTATNNNLISASYVVVVRDDEGCMDTTEIFLPQPSQLVVTTTQKNVSCFDDANGEITATVTGGTPTPGIPPTYNYNWSPANQTTQTAINLGPDIYTVTVTDNNNCSVVSNSVFITQPSNPLSLNVDSTDETCLLENGTATAFANGGTQPFNFNWTNSSGSLITQGPGISSINNLSPGSYNVEISDKNGCIISGSTFVNGVKNIFIPGNLDMIDTVICLGKSLSVNVEEKPGFIYLWKKYSTSDDWTPGPNTSDVNLQPTTTGRHNYTLSVTEPGCNPYEIQVNIDVEQIKSEIRTRNNEIYFRSDDVISPTKPVNILSVVSDESITISSNSNSGISHEWVWDLGTSTESDIQISNIDKNKWIYLSLDSIGCKGYDSVYVALSVIPFDAISPNGDMKNDTWNILGITANRYDQAIITIYNRWGEEIYKTYGGSQFNPWDGTKDGSKLPIGTYYYIIDLADQDESITGPVTIIR